MSIPDAPCPTCGYNGPGTHPCARRPEPSAEALAIAGDWAADDQVEHLARAIDAHTRKTECGDPDEHHAFGVMWAQLERLGEILGLDPSTDGASGIVDVAAATLTKKDRALYIWRAAYSSVDCKACAVLEANLDE